MEIDGSLYILENVKLLGNHIYKAFIVFAGTAVQALKGLWLIGDGFLNEIYYTLPSIKSEAATSKKKFPYMYDYYNITCFTVNPLSTVRSELACYVNALIKALNEKMHLPRFIIITPDADIVDYVCSYKAGITLLSGSAVNWIANQMIHAIAAKKESLRAAKPGSVAPYEPKIIWVKMLEIPESISRSSIAYKFNRAMDEMLEEKENHYVMDLNSIMYDAN